MSHPIPSVDPENVRRDDELTNSPSDFDSWEEAEEEYYKHHTCITDDPDEERARIERWMDNNNYTLK